MAGEIKRKGGCLTGMGKNGGGHSPGTWALTLTRPETGGWALTLEWALTRIIRCTCMLAHVV